MLNLKKKHIKKADNSKTVSYFNRYLIIDSVPSATTFESLQAVVGFYVKKVTNNQLNQFLVDSHTVFMLISFGTRPLPP